MAKQRPKGSGSVFYDARRDRWVGTLEAGWTTRGTRRRLTVSGRTEREARANLKAKEREVLLSGAPDEGARAGLTVKSYAETWLPRQERTLRPAAYSATRSGLTQWIVPTIGHKRLDKLSPADVRRVGLTIEDAGRATSTARRVHNELTRMLTDAHSDGHTIPERARTVKFGKPGESTTNDRDALPPGDARALLTTLATRPDRARWYLALAGLRPAEVRGLTWERVDFTRGVIVADWQLKALPYKVPRDRSSGFRVPRDYKTRYLHDAYHLVRPKTRSGWRVIPMTEAMREALEVWRDRPDVEPSPYGLVFHHGGRALDDKRDREAWHALLSNANLPARDLYVARHTIASTLDATGAASADMTAIMGHSSLVSTQAYLHPEIERSRAALETAWAAMREG